MIGMPVSTKNMPTRMIGTKKPAPKLGPVKN